jgi:hypothetical protein
LWLRSPRWLRRPWASSAMNYSSICQLHEARWGCLSAAIHSEKRETLGADAPGFLFALKYY